MGSAFTMCCAAVSPRPSVLGVHTSSYRLSHRHLLQTHGHGQMRTVHLQGPSALECKFPPVCSAPGVACPDTASYWSHLAPRMLMGVSDRPVLGGHEHWVHTYPPYLRAVREARARLHTLEAETEAWLCHLTVPGGVVFTDSVGQKAGCLGCCLW